MHPIDTCLSSNTMRVQHRQRHTSRTQNHSVENNARTIWCLVKTRLSHPQTSQQSPNKSMSFVILAKHGRRDQNYKIFVPGKLILQWIINNQMFRHKSPRIAQNMLDWWVQRNEFLLTRWLGVETCIESAHSAYQNSWDCELALLEFQKTCRILKNTKMFY